MTPRLPRCHWCGDTIKHDHDDPHADRIFNYEGEQYHLIECSTEMLMDRLKKLQKAHDFATRTYDDYH